MSISLKGFVFFAEHHRGLPKGLATAVIKQHGGWKSFRESAPSAAQYGVEDRVFSRFWGFSNHDDIRSFLASRRQLVFDLVCLRAAETPVKFVQDLRWLQKFTPSPVDVERCLCEGIAEDGEEIRIAQALVWFAAQEVVDAYQDFFKSQSLIGVD